MRMRFKLTPDRGYCWRSLLLKKCNKKNGVTVLAYCVIRLLKLGIFTGCTLKILNHLHTELSLDYLKDPKFYLESKASFIHISSIASFKLFLIAWLREYCTFSDSSLVILKSSPWPKYPQYGSTCILQKKIMFYYQTFFLLQICSFMGFLMLFSWDFPMETPESAP